MSRRTRSQFDDNLLRNRSSYLQYVDRLTELSISNFAWEGLPEPDPENGVLGVDARFMEWKLFLRGSVLFFEDEVLGFLALPFNFVSGRNVYGIPENRRAYASNGYQARLDPKNSVIIWNNLLHNDSQDIVREFARRLWNLDRIIDVNANAQKTPILLQGTEKQQLWLKNLYQQYDGNTPVIYGDRELDRNQITSINTGAPYVADRIYMLKTQIWNEALTYLGISNVAVQKKARLNKDEVNRNLGGTIASRFSRLQARQEAAEQINDMFGLNISVRFRDADVDGEDAEEPEKEPVPDTEGGGEDE